MASILGVRARSRAHESPSLSRAVPALALGYVALQLAVATRYGFHRDELYFLACARRLA